MGHPQSFFNYKNTKLQNPYDSLKSIITGAERNQLVL
jgi:hypothetical protein